MNNASLAKCALGLAAAALLAGCAGSSQSALSPSGALPAKSVPGAAGLPPALAMRLPNPAGQIPRPNHSKSWMSPEAKGAGPLLYTSNLFSNEVDVYAYKGTHGKVLGKLTGFDEPYGECSDASGNVYITNFLAMNVLEYAHGGTSPIKTIDDTYGEPTGCAVNPKTGDLAVTNFEGGPSGYGSMVVYQSASGDGTNYSIGQSLAWPPVYDNKGNLFFESQDSNTRAATLDELGSGSSELTAVALPPSITIYSPSGTTWDGKYIGLTDEQYQNGNTEGLFRLSISGSTATLVGQSDYTDTCYNSYSLVVQPLVYQKKLIGGNFWCYYNYVYHIDYWDYATGGNPVRFINGAATQNTAYGVAISK
jgi:hypothetical protein